jgi:hypothetical protein
MWRKLLPSLITIFGGGLVILLCSFDHPFSHAMEFQEVKPYVFAELPHGRIYKTVHEGCEVYIVESDSIHANDWDTHQYSITTGRGCK